MHNIAGFELGIWRKLNKLSNSVIFHITPVTQEYVILKRIYPNRKFYNQRKQPPETMI